MSAVGTSWRKLPPGTPTGHQPIRVLVADDSAFMRTALTRMIESDTALKVVGTAQDGIELLHQAAKLNPDVITLDVEMPRLDGLGALRQLMESDPRPVIMVSSLTQEGAEATLEALELGAFDCIPKQLSYASLDIIRIREQLIAKLKAAARTRPQPRSKGPKPAPPVLTDASIYRALPAPAVIVIGTSTGGPKALSEVIPQLPADLPAGVLVVQHMPPGFTASLARRLHSASRVTVREATDDHAIEAGQVLIAPAGHQMTVVRQSASRFGVRIGSAPPNTLHVPSVDVTMLSAAQTCGALAMGVILTGMGSDGAQGMKAIFEKGGITVGQDEATCVVYGMPKSCAELNVLRRIVPLEQVAGEILLATRYPTQN
jgi:two-component system chemotaxis response regulator CheB